MRACWHSSSVVCADGPPLDLLCNEWISHRSTHPPRSASLLTRGFILTLRLVAQLAAKVDGQYAVLHSSISAAAERSALSGSGPAVRFQPRQVPAQSEPHLTWFCVWMQVPSTPTAETLADSIASPGSVSSRSSRGAGQA